MNESEHLSLEEIRAFLKGNQEIEFKASDRKQAYEWTQRTLCAQQYMNLHRQGKGLVRQYVSKVTGLSRAQVTRLIAQYVASGAVRPRQGRGKRYTGLDTSEDIAVLAGVDMAHGTLSGPATRKLLYRGWRRIEVSRLRTRPYVDTGTCTIHSYIVCREECYAKAVAQDRPRRFHRDLRGLRAPEILLLFCLELRNETQDARRILCRTPTPRIKSTKPFSYLASLWLLDCLQPEPRSPY